MTYTNEKIAKAVEDAKTNHEPYMLNIGKYEVLSAYTAGQREGYENEYLNFDDVWAKDVPAIVESLREFGVDYITLSDTSTELMSILAAFTADYCDIVGMTKINHGLGWDPKKGPQQVNAIIISL